MLRNTHYKILFTLWRSIIHAALQHTAAMSMPCNIISMLCNSVEDHLCMARVKLLQAALNDMVTVAIQNQAQSLRFQLLNEQSCLIWRLNLQARLLCSKLEAGW